MESNIKINIRKEVLKTLNNIKIDTQEIKNQISFGCQSEETELEDFNVERLESNDVFLMTETLSADINRLKMLLNLLK